jgi:hypothetical protein
MGAITSIRQEGHGEPHECRVLPASTVEPEHLNPTMVRTMRKVFQFMRLRFDPNRMFVQQRRLSRKNSFGRESFGGRSPIRAFRMNRPGLKVAEQRK